MGAIIRRLVHRWFAVVLAFSAVVSSADQVYYLRIWKSGQSGKVFTVYGRTSVDLTYRFYRHFQYVSNEPKNYALSAAQFVPLSCPKWKHLNPEGHYACSGSGGDIACGAFNGDAYSVVVAGRDTVYADNYTIVANNIIKHCGVCLGGSAGSVYAWAPTTYAVSNSVIPEWVWNNPYTPDATPVLDGTGKPIGANVPLTPPYGGVAHPGTGGNGGFTYSSDTGEPSWVWDEGVEPPVDPGTPPAPETPAIDYNELYSNFAAPLQAIITSVDSQKSLTQSMFDYQRGIFETMDNRLLLANSASAVLEDIITEGRILQHNDMGLLATAIGGISGGTSGGGTVNVSVDNSGVISAIQSLQASQNGHWLDLGDNLRTWVADPIKTSVDAVKASTDTVKTSVDAVKDSVDAVKTAIEDLGDGGDITPNPVIPVFDDTPINDAETGIFDGNFTSIMGLFSSLENGFSGVQNSISSFGGAIIGNWRNVGSEPFEGFDIGFGAYVGHVSLTWLNLAFSWLRPLEVIGLWLGFLFAVMKIIDGMLGGAN